MTIAILRRTAAVLVALLLATSLGWAQTPKVGTHYDRSDLGFQVKTPSSWELVPPQPGDPNLIAKFDPKTVKSVQTGPNPPDRVFLSCWIVKFDRRKVEGEEKPKFAAKPLKTITEWVHKGNEVEYGSDHKELEKERKPLPLASKVPATEYQFETAGEEKTRKRVYAVVYNLEPELDIAIVFTGPGNPAKWHKYEGAFQQMARSFMRVELAAAGPALAADASLRDKERAKLQAQIDALGGGWKLYETPNYFVVTKHTDREFIAEILERLEAIRAQYEIDYPYEVAKELRAVGKAAKTGVTAADRKQKEDEEKAMSELFGDADPRELSRCSVVRILTDQGSYASYGGPPGSAGYWSPMARELVLYDDQASGGRNDTWIVLNHEAFHQYIFYLYGNISPHSWYNEGTGDFYSGLEYKNKRFNLKPNLWRRDTIHGAVQRNEHVPLKDFVSMTQREYYGSNKWEADGGQNYAQGWSFIYFLRTGKKNFQKNWNPAWDNILGTYFRVLATSGDLDQAVHEAFQGIDFDELEKAWKAST